MAEYLQQNDNIFVRDATDEFNRYQKVFLQNLIRHKSKLFVLTAEIHVFVRKI